MPKLEEQEPAACGTAASAATVPATKRKRVSSACVPCRRRKSKVTPRNPLSSAFRSPSRPGLTRPTWPQCDGDLPACAMCKAIYRMECVYDVEGDRRRRRRSIPGFAERNSNLLGQSVTEAGVIVDRLRVAGSLPPIDAPAAAMETVKHEKRKAAFDEEQDPVAIEPKNIGELHVDEQGSVRHFGYLSNLESIHSWSSKTSPGSYETQTSEWTTVTTDNDLIRDLLVGRRTPGAARPVPTDEFPFRICTSSGTTQSTCCSRPRVS